MKLRLAAFAGLVALAGCARSCSTRQIVTLASSQAEVGGLALDGDAVYWIERGTPDVEYGDGAVMRVAKSGGEARKIAPAGANSQEIAIDAERVYWTSTGGGRVMAAPKQGGDPVTLVEGSKSPLGIAVDAEFVYFTEGAWNGSIRKVPRAGGAPSPVALEQRYPVSVAVDGTHVYWTVSGSDRDGAVMKAERSGAAPVVVAADQRRPRALVLDGDHLYWMASPPAEEGSPVDVILRAPKSGGAPEKLTEVQHGASLAVDERNVYWTVLRGPDSGPGGVMGLPKRGGPGVAIAENENGPGAIAVDGSGIYWTTDRWSTRGARGETHDGAVRKTPK